MPDPLWITYSGAITGIIGAVTGVGGLILGYKGFRASKDIAVADLRLKLRIEDYEIRELIRTLPDLLASANQSRTRGMAADGLSRSGQAVVWQTKIDEDTRAVQEAGALQAGAHVEYAKLARAELESKLVAAHALRTQLAAIKTRYGEEMERDRKDVGRRRAAAEAKFLAATTNQPRQG